MAHTKIWESTLLKDTRNSQSVSVGLPATRPFGYSEFKRKYNDFQELPKAELPTHIYFEYRDTPKKKRDNLPDIFRGELGLVFVSGAMRDLMKGFDLGRTQFFEVPLFEHDQKTPRPGRWFMMHILEDRKTLVPEESIGLRPIGTDGRRWKTFSENDDKLAVDPQVAGDIDIWRDTTLRSSVFFSDRLKVAIKTSGLSARWLGFKPCKIIPKTA